MGGSSKVLSEEEIRIIVRRTLKTEDFKVGSFRARAASDTPMGFLGEHLKVTVEATLGNGEVVEFNYFVKITPRSVPQHLDYAVKIRAFYKEIELYKTLFVDLKNAQAKPVKWCPDYFYSRGEEMFVIEDLSTRGFYMLPERTLMDEEHIKASLKAMAAMHGASFVFEDKLRTGSARSLSPSGRNATGATSLGELYSHLTYETEVSDVEGHPGKTFIDVGIRSQTNIVDLLHGYTETEKRKVREKLPGLLRRILQLVKPSERFKNIFVHGDLWTNNILFRKGEDGKVEEAIIIDFQLARYAPPAHDLMTFLYLVQDRHFRKSKEEEMIHYYYDFLSKELSKNGVSVNTLLPKELFLESCQHYRELGLISAVLYFQLTMAPPSVAGKFMASPELYHKIMFVDRSEMMKECFAKDEIFRRRMSEAMEDLINEFRLK